jgi:Lipocalin-like domain
MPEEEIMRKVATFVVAIVMSLTHTPPMSAAFAQQSLKDRVVGAWKAISWESQRSNGQIVNIWMGLHPTGLIIYQPNGYMAVQFMADPRPTFAQNPTTNAPSYDEFRNAYFGYYAYWGTYTINDAGNGVIHNVQGSERPGEVGKKFPRAISIDGSKLVITTPSYKAGLVLPHDLLDRMQIPADEELVNRLTFERID